MLGRERLMAKSPARNSPCWCGSGKKYKKCHLDADLKARERNAAPSTRAREYWEIQRSVLKAPIRSDEVGPPRRGK
jgi:ribosomal protein L13E